MLTPEEQTFVDHWSDVRLKKKKSVWQWSVGLPLGIVIVVALFINLASGWYKGADAVLRSNSSLIITIIIASVAIVVFIAVFAARHQWDQKEQLYQELLAKKNRSGSGAAPASSKSSL